MKPKEETCFYKGEEVLSKLKPESEKSPAVQGIAEEAHQEDQCVQRPWCMKEHGMLQNNVEAVVAGGCEHEVKENHRM